MTALHAIRRKRKEGLGAVGLSFFFGALGAFFLFLPFLVVDKGFFLYCGDYNSQQIPFYMYVQQFIKTGGGTWSWATDLGSSFVTSYSFYNLGSPFLWISLLFPGSWMPFLMVPLFMLKFACIAGACALYLKRYAKSRNMLVVCSVIYAFCGFNIYNTFFNHMLDPVAIFPLLLWALDGFMLEKRRGWFALFVGLALLNSYFFFIGNVVFVILYFFVKVALKEYILTPKQFALLALEAVLGAGIGMALALPSFFNLISNPRTASFANGMGFVQYGNVQQYFNILSSLFLPPDPPYMPNLFTEGAIKWTSMSAFLPIVSVAGVAAYCKGRKRSWVKVLLIICLVCALVPILNSAFYAFNSSYYARWYYMPILMMVLATLYSLEDAQIDLVFGAKVALGITAGYALFGLLPAQQEDGSWKIGVAQYASKFWLTWLTAILAVCIFYYLVKHYRKKARFAPLLLAAVLSFSVFYGVLHIALGKFPQWERDLNFKAQTYDAAREIDFPDDTFYRIDAFGAYDNLGLWFDKSCLQTFNSTVNTSIMEFYPLVGVKRDVSSKPEATYYPLRGLLSVRYTLVPLNKMEVPLEYVSLSRQALGLAEDAAVVVYTDIPQEANFNDTVLRLDWAQDVDAGSTGAEGWKFWKIEGGYAIFENENFVPLGFTYDTYISMEHLQAAGTGDRSALLMRGIGLSQRQIEQYGHLFAGEDGVQSGQAQSGQAQSAYYDYEPVNYTSYVEDCAARRAAASSQVTADAAGFTASIYLEKENLVFFAVPYDAGFSATVNGEPAQVLQVSGGMMAVYAPAGENEIVFRYKTPGFGAGLLISLVSLLALGAYVWLCRRVRAKAVAAGTEAELPLVAEVITSAEGEETRPQKPQAPPGEGAEKEAGALFGEGPPGCG